MPAEHGSLKTTCAYGRKISCVNKTASPHNRQDERPANHLNSCRPVAFFMSSGGAMPYKDSFWAALAAFYNKFSEPINLLLIVTLSAVGRALYTGNGGKAVFGDLLICYIVVSVISPHIPHEIFGLVVNERDIAACVGIVGVHGMKQILAFAVKKKTGIDIMKNKDKQ